MASFITIRDDEAKLAGYLGFTNTTQLRQLVYAWPVVKAYVEFSQDANNVRKGGILKMINKSESDIFQDDPSKYWDLFNDSTENEQAGAVTAAETRRHIAWVILHMENDFKLYAADSEANNIAMSEQFRLQLFRAVHKPVAPSVLRCPVPALGPFEGEQRLESLSRCWNLLRFVVALQYHGGWCRVATQKGIDSGKNVEVEKIPAWMRPVEAEESQTHSVRATCS